MAAPTKTPRYIEYRLIADLPEALANPKGHDADLLDASLDRFGFTEPPLIDERTGRLIAGHGRKDMAARAEAAWRATNELTPIPDGIVVRRGRWYVPVVRGWSSANDEEAEAYLITSNRSVEAGGWVPEDLTEALARIDTTPRGLEGVGFSREQLDTMLAGLNPPEPDTRPQDIDARWEVVIVANDEAHQRELLDRFVAEGFVVRAVIV